jgi:HK97 family phage prohead protease
MVCSSCVFYEGPRACEVVAGDIDPAGICKLWVIPEVLITGSQPEQPTPEEMVMNSAPLDGYTRTEDGLDTPEKEVRRVHKLELRTDEVSGLPVLEGYATVYDYRYDIGDPASTGFTEVVSRGAAAKSAQEADVRLLINHDGLPLARTRSGTLELLSDEVGLRVSATLDPSNPSAAETISAMERGDVDQMSLAFRVLRQNYDSKTNVRTIQEMKLYDVSVVTFPANPATVVKLRNNTSADVEDAKLIAGRSVELARRQLDSDNSARR